MRSRKLPRVIPATAKLAKQIRPALDKDRPTNWPQVTDIWPTFGPSCVWSKLADVEQNGWLTSAQIGTDWSNLANKTATMEARFCQNWPKVSENWSTPGEIDPNLPQLVCAEDQLPGHVFDSGRQLIWQLRSSPSSLGGGGGNPREHGASTLPATFG